MEESARSTNTLPFLSSSIRWNQILPHHAQLWRVLAPKRSYSERFFFSFANCRCAVEAHAFHSLPTEMFLGSLVSSISTFISAQRQPYPSSSLYIPTPLNSPVMLLALTSPDASSLLLTSRATLTTVELTTWNSVLRELLSLTAVPPHLSWSLYSCIAVLLKINVWLSRSGVCTLDLTVQFQEQAKATQCYIFPTHVLSIFIYWRKSKSNQ